MLEYLRLLRPHHWTKNLLVFTGIFFAGIFFSSSFLSVLLMFFAFCIASSIIYVFNDIKDRELDLKHPIKKNRPIPSKKVKVKNAYILVGILLLILLFTSLFLSINGVVVLVSYLVLNFFYVTYLKNIAIVDVFSISLGYILRVLGGTIAIGLDTSLWLLITVMTLSLFLAFTKRYNELNFSHHKKVLLEYNKDTMNDFIKVTLTLSLVFYTIYVLLEKNNFLSFCALFLVYLGIFKYLLKFQNSKSNYDPIKVFLKDSFLIIIFIIWGILQFLGIYLI